MKYSIGGVVLRRYRSRELLGRFSAPEIVSNGFYWPYPLHDYDKYPAHAVFRAADRLDPVPGARCPAENQAAITNRFSHRGFVKIFEVGGRLTVEAAVIVEHQRLTTPSGFQFSSVLR